MEKSTWSVNHSRLLGVFELTVLDNTLLSRALHVSPPSDLASVAIPQIHISLFSSSRRRSLLLKHLVDWHQDVKPVAEYRLSTVVPTINPLSSRLQSRKIHSRRF